MLPHALNAVLFAVWSMVSFFTFFNYRFLSLELLVILGIYITFLFIVVVISIFLKQPWLFYSFLIFLAFDFIWGCAHPVTWGLSYENNFEGLWLFIAGIPSHSILLFVLAILQETTGNFIRYTYPLAFLLSLGVGFLLRRKIMRYALNVLGVLLISLFFQAFVFPSHAVEVKSNVQKGSLNPPKDNILMIALDEHIGFAGMPSLKQEGYMTGAAMAGKYLAQGFHAYANAFSNYSISNDSFTSILGYKILEETKGLSETEVSENRIFKAWLDRGYDLQVYQSKYLDFCSSFKEEYSNCLSYEHNSIGHIQNLPLSLKDKVLIIISSYIQFHKGYLAHQLWTFFLKKAVGGDKPLLTPFSFDVILPHLLENLNASTTGQAIFVHFLLPHFPYVYDSECNVKALEDWELGAMQGESSWQKKYRNYYEQIGCTEKKLNSIFEHLRKKGIFDHTQIIIFGDHGSRIKGRGHEPVSETRSRIDDFSTLFMVKLTGAVEGKYKTEKESVATLVHRYTGLPAENEGFDKVHLARVGVDEHNLGKITLEEQVMPEF